MLYPNFRYEKNVWKQGYKIIAGIDEVGRGALAGPVVAGCAVFKRGIIIPCDIKINDSKKLTAGQRLIADVWVKENALTWGIGEVSAREIDRVGIVKATNKAMRIAIGKANQRFNNRIQYVFIDAYYIPYTRGIRMPIKRYRRKRVKSKYISNYNELRSCYGQQTAVVKGDEKIFTVAAASIIAKVYRDNLMIDLSKSKKYEKYGWEKSKGYGTLLHRIALKNYGLSKFHRTSFIINIGL